jgi:hypothetical protein
MSETLLRERVYQATLAWFFLEPTHHNEPDRKVMESNIQILIEFCKEIDHEDAAAQKTLKMISTQFRSYDLDDQSPQGPSSTHTHTYPHSF